MHWSNTELTVHIFITYSELIQFKKAHITNGNSVLYALVENIKCNWCFRKETTLQILLLHRQPYKLLYSQIVSGEI